MAKRAPRKIGYHPERLPIRQRELSPKKVNSTAVESTSYDIESEQLTIVFKERGTYVYYDVPIHVWVEFNGAGSRGTYFNLYLRNASYSYERIG